MDDQSLDSIFFDCESGLGVQNVCHDPFECVGGAECKRDGHAVGSDLRGQIVMSAHIMWCQIEV